MHLGLSLCRTAVKKGITQASRYCPYLWRKYLIIRIFFVMIFDGLPLE